MDLPETKQFTRRQFLNTGLTLASASIAAPYFLQRSALALPRPTSLLSSLAGVEQDRVLVVVQLSGGNDGLNTVIPFRDDAYYRSRQTIGVARDQVLALSSRADLGLHPQMTGIKRLFDDGLCAIVQGVGYPNPNRSHFKSMDIWHTADTSGTGDGWLGRYFDAECCGEGAGENGQPDSRPQPGIAIGSEAPLAMQGRQIKPIAFESEDLFRWTGQDVHASLKAPYDEIVNRGISGNVDPNSNAAFLIRTALDAQVSSEQIRKAVRQQPLVQYPRTQLGRQLAMVGAMIRAGLPTRVYYVSHGGFDTHSGQGGANGRHAQLLQQFSQAIAAFYDDLREQQNDGRVLTMSFSEFGRRVAQNASGGTDHGTAAPMFLFGPMVQPGLLGAPPSLTDLDNGDLKYTTDFRSVYAGILANWMLADPMAILDGNFRPERVIR